MNQEERYEPSILQPKGWRKWLRYGILISVTIIFLAPVFWMVSSALKPEYQIFAVPPIWWPDPPRWENFSEALTSQPFGRYTINTLIIAIGVTIGHLISCSIVAYGFARLEAPGKGFLFIMLLSTLMLPYPVTMVPLYIIFSRIGWVNNFYPLIVPAFLGNAFYIFLLRQSLNKSQPNWKMLPTWTAPIFCKSCVMSFYQSQPLPWQLWQSSLFRQPGMISWRL